MKHLIAMAVVALGALSVDAGPLKNIRERREARHTKAEVVIQKDGAKKVVVRGDAEAVVTKDRVELKRVAPAKKAN